MRYTLKRERKQKKKKKSSTSKKKKPLQQNKNCLNSHSDINMANQSKLIFRKLQKNKFGALDRK